MAADTIRLGLEQVVADRTLERVALYVGDTRFVDSRYNVLNVERNVDNSAVGSANSLTLDLGGVSPGEGLFARIGVKTVGVEEMIYTPVQLLSQP